MKILFLSRVPFEVFKNYMVGLNDEIFIITEDRFLSEYEQKIGKNVYGFDNYFENPEVVEFSVELINRENINLLIAVDEADIERGALIRKLSGLSGQSEDCAIRYRDKLIMKNTLKEKIDMPNYNSVKNLSDIEQFIEQYNYPVVLKHRRAWATIYTKKINNTDELLNYTKSINNFEEYIVEEWIDDAVMYTVEGIQRNGHLEWFAIHEYDRNLLESVSNGDGFTTFTSQFMNYEDQRNRIKQYAEMIINLLNQSNKFTSAIHLEFFITKNDKFIFNEIGSRMGGGRIYDLLKEAYDVDLPNLLITQYKKEANNEAMDYPPITKPKYFIGTYKKYYVRKKEALNQLKNKDWILKIYDNKIKNEYQPTLNINDFEVLILVKEKSYEDLKNRLSILKKY